MKWKSQILTLVMAAVLVIPSSMMNFELFANPNDYTVEGDMTRFATGNAYPKQIKFTGYNAADDELYLSIEFEGGASYDYEINVYQGGTGALWGSTTGLAVVDAVTPTMEVTNKSVSATAAGTDLQIANRIVVTVTDYTP